MYVYNWVILLYSRNERSTVSQLHVSKIDWKPRQVAEADPLHPGNRELLLSQASSFLSVISTPQ